jgi:hypothetical protein
MSPAASKTAEPPDGGGVVTVTVLVPLFPPVVAVIVAEPGATPVTRPVDDTLPTEGFELIQVNDACFPDLRLAVNCSVWPTSRVAVAGCTVTNGSANGGIAPPVSSDRSGEPAISVQPSASHARRVAR